jgi:hypothetical protein
VHRRCLCRRHHCRSQRFCRCAGRLTPAMQLCHIARPAANPLACCRHTRGTPVSAASRINSSGASGPSSGSISGSGSSGSPQIPEPGIPFSNRQSAAGRARRRRRRASSPQPCRYREEQPPTAGPQQQQQPQQQAPPLQPARMQGLGRFFGGGSGGGGGGGGAAPSGQDRLVNYLVGAISGAGLPQGAHLDSMTESPTARPSVASWP